MSEKRIAYISHPDVLLHIQSFPKPHIEAFESPIRIQMIEHHLQERGVFPDLQRVLAPSGSDSDVLRVHTPYVLDTVKLMSNLGGGSLGESAYASPDLYRTALLAIGGAMKTANMVVEQEVTHALSIMRPPGHHASTSTPAGLCFFNNVAIAVTQILEHKAVDRISILDFDNHFGNGTSEIFYDNPNVQFISIHEYDFENFGTGHFEEVGFGDAKGTNINIPLMDFAPDRIYEKALQDIITPAIKMFEPSMIAVSAGYDAHYADPVGNMDIDSRTFWLYAKTIDRLVREQSMLGSFWTLEGGYGLFSVGPSVEASIQGLMNKEQPKLSDQIEREQDDIIVESNEEILEKVQETISPFW